MGRTCSICKVSGLIMVTPLMEQCRQRSGYSFANRLARLTLNPETTLIRLVCGRVDEMAAILSHSEKDHEKCLSNFH
jgi:hypothetical protein